MGKDRDLTWFHCCSPQTAWFNDPCQYPVRLRVRPRRVSAPLGVRDAWICRRVGGELCRFGNSFRTVNTSLFFSLVLTQIASKSAEARRILHPTDSMERNKVYDKPPVPNSPSAPDGPKRETDEAKEICRVPPNGGVQAWLCVVGGFCCQFCSFGFVNA